MSNFFVAVGGTGQMVALAYFRLAKLCGFKKPAYTYIMDSDIDGDVSQDLMQLLGEESVPVIKPIPRADNIETFRDIFSNSEYDDNIQPVLPLLFTTEELDTHIRKGMYGRPPVGSTCLSVKMKNIENRQGSDTALSRLITALREGQTNNVVICGSLFGGTGAGGIPTLAKYIRREVGPGIKITIIDLLRWFWLPEQTHKSHDSMLKHNAESGVCYLQDKIADSVNACVLLGLEEPVERTYEEIGKQTEKINFINLIAAIIANNSFNVAEYKSLFPNEHSIYSYVVPDNGLKASNIKVLMPIRNNTVKLHEIIMLSRAVEKFLGFFEKYIYSGPPGFSFTPSLAIPSKLIIAIKRSSSEVTCNEVYDKVKEKREEYHDMLEWFKNLKDSPVFETDHTEITGTKYQENLKYPMPFLRKWINGIDDFGKEVNNAEEFVDQMIKQLRVTINEMFLNNKFGKMSFL